MPSPALIDPDWSRYPSTVLTFVGEPKIHVDLRRALGEHELRGLAGIGLDMPFAVITAHDPRGADLPGRDNERRAARLEEQLRSLDIAFTRVDACSAEGEHCEASVAARMPLEAARSVARDFGQVAFFWFDGERFWIAGGVADTEPIALPRRS